MAKLGAAKPGLIIFVCGILGLLIAAIQQAAFDNEWMLNLYLDAAELPGLQILTVVLFLLCGGVIAAVTS